MSFVLVVLVVAALLAGMVVGVLAAPLVSSHSSIRRNPASGLTTSQVLDLIVLASDSGIAVVDKHRDVVLANPRASELGLVTGGLLDDRAWDAAQEVLRTGVDAERDLTNTPDRAPSQPGTVVSGRSRIAVRCVARPLSSQAAAAAGFPDGGGARASTSTQMADGSGFVVIFADDDSEQARMEATRRDFVANVSHELKTPVGAMGLLAEAMLESADDPASVRHFGQRVLAESVRLGNMVSELIALSRLQGAEKLPHLDVVDVDTVVAEAVDRSRTAAEAADITVSTDRPSGLEVLGDQTLLVTALSNLVENAIAYSPKGSHVSVSRSLRGDRVAMAVTDRGIGIAAHDQERVFERFFRVDKARSRSTGGTGLGLAIVKHVAANHNGEITLWSKLGTGSTFTLRIPVYQETEHSSPSASAMLGNFPAPARHRESTREDSPPAWPDETLSSVEVTR